MFAENVPDLTAAVEAIRRGDTSPEALWDLAETRFRRFEPRLQAFVYADWEGARIRLPQAPSGPLWGMPVGIKDLVDVAGMPTTGGSRAYRWIPETDAPAVARLKAAGAVVVGKTNTHELAYGVITPPTRNPYDPERIPGGSSGGSAAAVAAGMVLAALGSDTGGSIRIPAACCGVVGFKPTTGRVPAAGVMPLSWTVDHVGPLAHSVRDAVRLYAVLAGEPALPSLHPPARVRVAVPEGYLDGTLDDGVRGVFERALAVLRDLGWTVGGIAMEPWPRWRQLFADIRGPEAFVYHQPLLDSPGAEALGPAVRQNLENSRHTPAATYIRALRERAALAAAWAERMRDVDAVVLPTIPVPAPPVGADTVVVAGRTQRVWETLLSYTAPWNILGYPAVAVPAGLTPEGLPVGLQIVGPSGADHAVLALGAAFEAASGWDALPPPWTRLEEGGRGA
jgi:aspartyl-tRNA(Asn)/glutamyl-tRNA(Gln) amidotransferase subunit A